MMFYGKLLCLILLLVIAQAVQAETIEELMTAGELEARVVVETPTPLFQKAPIMIGVEVGTPNRFKDSTRIRDFTVPGTLVRPVSKSAFNETRRRGGDTWAFQTLRFRLYPGHAGPLRPPPLTTFVSVETKTHGVVEGEIRLQAPVLEIEPPPGTEGLASWVATTEFEVDESWEGVLETYQVGDAVTRIRRFTIKEVPAMAIPASSAIKIDGVQVYSAPEMVKDKTVGNSLEGIREERVVFTFKVGGSHTIPQESIYWFNLKNKRLEQIDFSGRTLDVSGGGKADVTAAAKVPEDGMAKLLYWGLAILGAALIYVLLRWFQRTTWYHYVREHLEIWREHRRAKTAFMRAAEQQNSRRCLALLYKRMSEHAEWQLSTACATDQQLSGVAAALMAHAYGDGQPPKASELQHLWEVCTTPKKQRDNLKKLRLNPGPSQ